MERGRFLEELDINLSQEHKVVLDDMPSEHEIRESLWMLPSGKSPGIDGMGPEIMKLLWPVIGRLFSLAVIEFWESGDLPAAFKDGLIFLLPKVPCPEALGQWRPITLLNAIYKVIAKLLACRLAFILPEVIPVEQQGFVRGRSPQNCILTFCLVHEALKMDRRLPEGSARDALCPPFCSYLLPSPLSSTFISNTSGQIKSIKLPGGHSASCMCLADDLAVFTELDRGSVDNLLGLLRRIQFVSGGKVNISKSRLFLLGKCARFPPWVRTVGLQVVDQRQVSRYLGAPLTMIWVGSDNGRGALEKVQGRARALLSPLLSFESRVLVLKHALFPVLIYQLFTTRRGGFAVAEFQQALLCRTLLKALIDPTSSLWAPLFAKCFLDVQPDQLIATLCFRQPLEGLKQCPFTMLLISAWQNFLSLFRWVPAQNDAVFPENLQMSLFLAARTRLGVKDARVVVKRLGRWCSDLQIDNTSDLLHNAGRGSLRISDLPDEDKNILSFLLSGSVGHRSWSFSDVEWVGPDGMQFDLGWRAGDIYDKLMWTKVSDLVHRLNSKWSLQWEMSRWSKVWELLTIKEMSFRHRCFFWKIMTISFFVGAKARTWGFQHHGCDFCGCDVEDLTHAIWLCPRWDRFWRVVFQRIRLCREAECIRNDARPLPEVLLWVSSKSGRERVFIAWFFALA
ncbi:hypothetical protein R1sor_015362 [Riccia sorocarpa]|uniref:Reverse transcriptase domain-containing protein n=1 Tax=Riccia sorocarpa TaxID=122646 RepID=A0ABD3HCC9_9MARC